MSNLSARGTALLQEFAKDHGVSKLDFDRDGLIPMTIGDAQLALAYSPANDSFFFIAAIRTPEEGELADPWQAFALSGNMAARRTRIAIEPKSKLEVLVREVLLEGLTYTKFLTSIDEFICDLISQRGTDQKREKNVVPMPALPEDVLLFRI
jgi:hypothetical protein